MQVLCLTRQVKHKLIFLMSILNKKTKDNFYEKK